MKFTARRSNVSNTPDEIQCTQVTAGAMLPQSSAVHVAEQCSLPAVRTPEG